MSALWRPQHKPRPASAASQGSRPVSGAGAAREPVRVTRRRAWRVFSAPDPSVVPHRVGIIGVGRVGASLGAALGRAGYEVVAASAVSEASLDRMGRLLPDTRCLTPDQVCAEADLLILSVPDDVLAGLVRGLAEVGAFQPGHLVAHTSGAHGVGVLAPAVAAGARPLALHPAMTFTGSAADLDRLASGMSFGVTVPDDLRPVAARLVADLGCGIEWVAETDRPLYHAALAHGANHIVTLVNEALDRLRDAGVARPDRVLGPLARAALDNALALGDAALTGPVSRGDAGTVAAHLATLHATAPDSVPAYLALARRTADRAIGSHRLRAADAEPLLDVLADHELRAATARQTSSRES
jgi:predicted short-subunit dehydrogenase-like oxidoreductase (DUF2520 family)